MTCCDDRDDESLDVVDDDELETETFHMCGDDCACGHGLAIEDGHVL